MNISECEQPVRKELSAGRIKAVIGLFTLISLGLCVWSFSIGCFIIVQNLVYLPIVLACAFFAKRGLAFSVFVALSYLLLLVVYSNDQTVILGGLARVFAFIAIGVVVTFITVRKQSAEEALIACKGNLESLIAEKTMSLEQIIQDKSSIITELKQVEQAQAQAVREWQATFDNVNDVIWLLDPDQRVLRSNRTAETVFGIPASATLGRYCWEIVHGTQDPNPDCPVARMRRSHRREVMELEVRGRVFAVSVDPVLDADDTLTGAIHVVSDITARKAGEKALLQAKKAQSLECMAGAVAHRYNNLMGAVLGNLELAEIPGVDPTEVAKLIATARAAAELAADVSRLMLAYLGHAVGNRKPLELTAICRETISDMAPRLPAAVRLEFVCESPGAVVSVDTSQLRQVLRALMLNATEAIQNNGGVIVVTVTESNAADLPAEGMVPLDWHPAQGQRYACLSVRDTGAGMPPEILEKIFDPFFSTRFTGRGLGLPVVLGIVRAHDGSVSVESRVGSGTVIRVFLPLCADCSPECLLPTGQTEPAEERRRVLVVDDDSFLLPLAQQMIESLDFEAVCASDGPAAIEVFAASPHAFCCVLCDLTMPEMNGWETMTALREIRADIPLILCSGYNESSVMGGDSKELPRAFLGKPYDRARLADALATALSRTEPAHARSTEPQ